MRDFREKLNARASQWKRHNVIGYFDDFTGYQPGESSTDDVEQRPISVPVVEAEPPDLTRSISGPQNLDKKDKDSMTKSPPSTAHNSTNHLGIPVIHISPTPSHASAPEGINSSLSIEKIVIEPEPSSPDSPQSPATNHAAFFGTSSLSRRPGVRNNGTQTKKQKQGRKGCWGGNAGAEECGIFAVFMLLVVIAAAVGIPVYAFWNYSPSGKFPYSVIMQCFVCPNKC